MKPTKSPHPAQCGAIALLLASVLSPALAAKSRSVSPQKLRRLPPLRVYSYTPSRFVITPRTDPRLSMSKSAWDRYVRTQMPEMGKVDPGPFAVQQNRRFERGETLVPPSVHTF
jgi:hypothetical protein